MKKLSTEITTKKGEIKIITVEVDDIYADWLVTQPQEIYHDAVMFEYRTSCTERKETRYIQSLDASMDNGFDIADETENIEAEIIANETLEMMFAILPEEQRWAVVEHIIKGVPKTKLAQIKNVSDAAIGQQIKRALNTLRKKFSTFFDYPV